MLFNSKTTNESTTYYYYNGDRLIGEDGSYGRIRYMYDQKEIVGVRFFPTNGDMVEYEYIKDATGSVIAILKDSTIVAQYTYDAWGNIINQNINYSDVFAQINPIRYKGYYFDREIGLYYLQSRYYNPEIGAFISPDSVDYLDPENIGGLNLYCYCNNNPIMYVDRSGHFAISVFLIGLAVSSLVGWGLSEIFGAQVVGGASSIINGAGAIKTGASLCMLGPWGIVAGIGLIVSGGLTIAMGANEMVDGIIGTNYIQEWTGMSDGLYTGLNIGLNVISSVGTIAGNMHLNRIRTNALNGLDHATYGPKASKHIGERSYYNSKLTQQQIIKGGQIRRAKYGVPGYEFRIKGTTVMGKSGNVHSGMWSLVYGDGIIWHFLLS